MPILLAIVGGTIVMLAVGSVTFTVAAEFGAARHRRRHPPACAADADDMPPWPARVLATAALIAREAAANVVLALTLPLPTGAPAPGALPDGARRPIVLLHGYAQHPLLLVRLARLLHRDGWRSCHLVRHRSVWGDIATSATRLQAHIDDIRRRTGAGAVDIVAHSMGGLVARACVRAGGGAGVARLITLGTPHQGTDAFRGWTFDPMVAQMRPESPFLHTLATHDPVPDLADCISIYSTDDALVLPARNAYYPGAFNIELRGLGHLSLLFSRRVYELVRENLAADLAPRVRAS